MLEKRTEPHLGAKTRPIYDLLSEFPGVESSAAEIAGELGETPAKVLEQLRNLWVSGYVQKTGPRQGRKGNVRWFVEANHVQP